jgi:hypothetical protein
MPFGGPNNHQNSHNLHTMAESTSIIREAFLSGLGIGGTWKNRQITSSYLEGPSEAENLRIGWPRIDPTDGCPIDLTLCQSYPEYPLVSLVTIKHYEKQIFLLVGF